MVLQYMVMKPEDLSSEELKYEMEIRNFPIQGLTTRQITGALNQNMLNEKENPLLFSTLRSNMMFDEEKQIIVSNCAEILTKFKTLVTFEALQVLISRTIHYFHRTNRMNAFGPTQEEFVTHQCTDIQLLMDRMAASIQIVRNEPRLALHLGGLNIHNSLQSRNDSQQANSSIDASHKEKPTDTTQVITSNSNLSQSQYHLNITPPIVTNATALTTNVIPTNNILATATNSLTVPSITVTDPNTNTQFIENRENDNFDPKLHSSLTFSNNNRSIDMNSFSSELNEIEKEQRLTKDLVDKTVNDYIKLSEQVSKIGGALESVQSQMAEFIQIALGQSSSDFRDLMSLINKNNQRSVRFASTYSNQTHTSDRNAPISSTQFGQNGNSPDNDQVTPSSNVTTTGQNHLNMPEFSVALTAPTTTLPQTITSIQRSIVSTIPIMSTAQMNSTYTPVYPTLPVTDSFRTSHNTYAINPYPYQTPYASQYHPYASQPLPYSPYLCNNNMQSQQSNMNVGNIPPAVPLNTNANIMAGINSFNNNNHVNVSPIQPTPTIDSMNVEKRNATTNVNHIENMQTNSTQHNSRSFNNDRRIPIWPIHKWNIRFSGMTNCSELKSGDTELDSYEFLEKVNKLRISENISTDILLSRIDCLLLGIAKTWFKAYQDDFDSWETFVNEFKRQFQKENFELELRKRMQETIQNKDELPSNYVLRMICLANRLGTRLSETEKVAYVMNGLHESIAGPIRLFKPKTIRELSDLLKSYDSNKVIPIGEPAPQQKRSFSYNSYYNKNHMRQNFNKQLEEMEKSPFASESNDNDDNCSEFSFVVDANEVDTVKMKNIHDYKNKFSRDFKYDKGQSEKRYYCYNCGEPDHTHATCRRDRKLFCYGCGKLDVHTLDCDCLRSQRFKTTHSKNSRVSQKQPPDINTSRD